MMLLLEKEGVEILADLVLDKLEEGGDRNKCAEYANLYTVLSKELKEEEEREKSEKEPIHQGEPEETEKGEKE